MSRNSDLPGRVAILGFARSGEALAKALARREVAVTVGEAKPRSAFDAETVARLERKGVRFDFDGPKMEFLDGAQWLAISPGVPMDSPVVVEARRKGLAVLAEIEIAWRIAQAEVEGKNRWVAVTGTNGKSTTTAWIAEILRRAGRPVALAGNIGVPLSAFLSERSARDFVCEVSSFQLEAIDRFHPHVAVLTNITPDHLDRHDGFADYVRAKARVFENQDAGDFAVVNDDDTASRPISTRSRRVAFSRKHRCEGGAWIDSGSLVSEVSGRKRSIVAQKDLALPGAHNVENALAALAAAACLDTPEAAIADALSRFQGLPHRTELVAERDGVSWVDDSKGTNVDATKKSLEGFGDGRVLLILGGRDKHGDFAALGPSVARAARKVFTIGEAARAIEKVLSSLVEIENAGTMDRAVRRASEVARPGDTVLLSPACASFDQYRNFEERGDHFARLAREVTRSHGA
ncbi:MAG TPA: UDP-N-acetylmuramoyl-L-alanine--D-glutamate ligase [Thermoanaerobaculia bacterium]|nr:UDP-N-acetylmuramoyl-L-alanine--D-glutamate ligase [Thermoanaerobaculia bacterium]